MHPRDLAKLRMALSDKEKKRLLRIGSALGCQEKGSRSKEGGREMRNLGGVCRGKPKTQRPLSRIVGVHLTRLSPFLHFSLETVYY